MNLTPTSVRGDTNYLTTPLVVNINIHLNKLNVITMIRTWLNNNYVVLLRVWDGTGLRVRYTQITIKIKTVDLQGDAYNFLTALDLTY